LLKQENSKRNLSAQSSEESYQLNVKKIVVRIVLYYQIAN